MADAIFGEPRLAAVYDACDSDRSDLDAYAALVAEFAAQRVLDIGCGTGTFACLLATQGIEVIALDPAAASLAVARAKAGAERVRWIQGDATSLPALRVDLATMTGNVAQVFLSDQEWQATLRSVRSALRPGGRIVFETRDLQAKGWLAWNRENSYKRVIVPNIGAVEGWVEVIEVRSHLVSFRHTYVFESDGAVLTSDSTLRFRDRAEVTASLLVADLILDEVRDAPDRPGLEFVFVARRAN
ncbi:MAG: class I SAM-dependent methyltransferase [Ktedonobacterales bacterium]|nr:class I SAM-dependent methyltransferase [Ktedonobacterales bacterium]